MLHALRPFVLPALAVLFALGLFVGFLFGGGWWAFAGVFGALLLLGLRDRYQSEHAILRNYPVLGHLRYALEDLGPELRQYIVEHNLEGRPFNRDQRSLVYQRAKGAADVKPFGSELDSYREGHRWITHSLRARHLDIDPVEALRIRVGGPDCRQTYDASLLNVSAMSFGSLSPTAIEALNEGARRGHFAHNTGEGGLSRYHLGPGGDLVWQIGTGYFGCRGDDGGFDEAKFAEGATRDAVKMIELKLSQGAKPGKGGVLPAAKITPEIAEARGIEQGRDCVSPPGHSAFDTPAGLLEFVARLREASGGKPTGIKLAIGEPIELMSIARAMHETGILPDFVTVDGGEGGTGAAPVEFSDHMGMPMLEALVLVHNVLTGIGERGKVRVFAAGKVISSVDMAMALALGADAINVARGFMFALGCIQAQRCHTNMCPVGVATQNPELARAIEVDSKADRVASYHRNTLEALAEVVGAAGLEHPGQLAPKHVYERVSPWEIRPFSRLYPTIESGALLEGGEGTFLQHAWREASSARFGA